MLNSIVSWLSIMGLIIGPFSIGFHFEEKLQRANRELGSRLLRRY
jgi:predicted Kef-type K+ transport protein